MKKTTKRIVGVAATLFLAVLWACRDEVVAPPRLQPISSTASPPVAAQALSAAGVCDRTPQVRDAIMAAAESTCGNVTGADLAAIDSLNLAGPPKIFAVSDDCLDRIGQKSVHGDKVELGPCEPLPEMVAADQTTSSSGAPEIHALLDHDFEGLSGLQHLLLQDNWLVELPDNVFDPLVNLRRLDLSRNMLTSLPDGVFDDLADLREFRATGNRLDRLADGIFDASPELGYVAFSSNVLTELPDGLFDRSPQLWYVAFTSNVLSELPDGLFDASPRLRYAYFSGNQLTELPDGLFDASPGLRYAIFSGNQLSELPDGLFDASPELRYAYFRSNKLGELPAGLFGTSAELQYVSFSSNELTELPEDLFNGTSSLRYASFSFNRLEKFPQGLLNGQPDLETVSFWYNKLTELPGDALRGLTSLEYVDFDDNRLTRLPEGLFDGLTSLNYVFFRGNPGSPFTLSPMPERVDNADPLAPGPAMVQLKLAQAAPFTMSVAVRGVGGAALSNRSMRFEAGDTESSAVTVDITRAPAGVAVDAPSPTPECDGCVFRGLEIVTGRKIVLANPPQATIKIAGAYLTQAAQNLEGSVPLVAGRDALLRVFATSDVVNNYKIAGQATVYDGPFEWQGDMTPPEGGMGVDVEEGRLESSFNLRIPGGWLGPGTTVLIRLIPDADANLTDESQLVMSFTPDVRDVAPLDVKVVPIQYGWHKNSGTNEIVADFARDLVEWDSEDQLQFTRKLLPISSLNMSLREPYVTFADTTEEGGLGILNEVQLLRHLEAGGTDEYYHGVLAFPTFQGPGLGVRRHRGEHPRIHGADGLPQLCRRFPPRKRVRGDVRP